jgi:hypothetical protein
MRKLNKHRRFAVTTRRHSGDDYKIAKAYISKSDSARTKGYGFTLSYTSFKNMCKAKKCYFTGLPLTAETFTIDRIDNTKPYEHGNVVACHRDFNNLKSLIENPDTNIDLKKAIRGLNLTQKRIKGK